MKIRLLIYGALLFSLGGCVNLHCTSETQFCGIFLEDSANGNEPKAEVNVGNVGMNPKEQNTKQSKTQKPE